MTTISPAPVLSSTTIPITGPTASSFFLPADLLPSTPATTPMPTNTIPGRGLAVQFTSGTFVMERLAAGPGGRGHGLLAQSEVTVGLIVPSINQLDADAPVETDLPGPAPPNPPPPPQPPPDSPGDGAAQKDFHARPPPDRPAAVVAAPAPAPVPPLRPSPLALLPDSSDHLLAGVAGGIAQKPQSMLITPESTQPPLQPPTQDNAVPSASPFSAPDEKPPQPRLQPSTQDDAVSHAAPFSAPDKDTLSEEGERSLEIPLGDEASVRGEFVNFSAPEGFRDDGAGGGGDGDDGGSGDGGNDDAASQDERADGIQSEDAPKDDGEDSSADASDPTSSGRSSGEDATLDNAGDESRNDDTGVSTSDNITDDDTKDGSSDATNSNSTSDTDENVSTSSKSNTDNPSGIDDTRADTDDHFTAGSNNDAVETHNANTGSDGTSGDNKINNEAVQTHDDNASSDGTTSHDTNNNESGRNISKSDRTGADSTGADKLTDNGAERDDSTPTEDNGSTTSDKQHEPNSSPQQALKIGTHTLVPNGPAAIVKGHTLSLAAAGSASTPKVPGDSTSGSGKGSGKVSGSDADGESSDGDETAPSDGKNGGTQGRRMRGEEQKSPALFLDGTLVPDSALGLDTSSSRSHHAASGSDGNDEKFSKPQSQGESKRITFGADDTVTASAGYGYADTLADGRKTDHNSDPENRGSKKQKQQLLVVNGHTIAVPSTSDTNSNTMYGQHPDSDDAALGKGGKHQGKANSVTTIDGHEIRVLKPTRTGAPIEAVVDKTRTMKFQQPTTTSHSTKRRAAESAASRTSESETPEETGEGGGKDEGGDDSDGGGKKRHHNVAASITSADVLRLVFVMQVVLAGLVQLM